MVKDDEKEKKEPEPSFESLQNPARVLRQQLKVIQLVEGSHYTPVKDIQIGGIVMVKHTQADTEEELVEPVAGEWLILCFLLKTFFWKLILKKKPVLNLYLTDSENNGVGNVVSR